MVAGRNGTQTRGLGIELNLDSRVFDFENAQSNLEDIDVVLNCTGPFGETSEPMVDACRKTGTDYLDITGELAVFEALTDRDRAAEKANVALIPGVGFDVVPTDCLAGSLHDRHPTATQLRLLMDVPGDPSGGRTVLTAMEHAGTGVMMRRNGSFERAPLARLSRPIDFGSGPTSAVMLSMGDLPSAYYRTGIENIRVYVALPAYVQYLVWASNFLKPLVGIGPLRQALQAIARRVVSDPDVESRATEQVSLWVWRPTASTLSPRTPEPYALTVDAVTTALEGVTSSEITPG